MSNQNKVSKKFDFTTVVNEAVRFPGVRIDRSEFLRKELAKYYDEETIQMAIDKSPAKAGISVEVLKPISEACIKYETNKVTTLSAVAGIPGGLAMFGTVPADVIQYFAHIIRILQKLIYLYGWQEINTNDDDLNDETMNELTLFMGVMFGVNAANATIGKLAQSAAAKAEKSLVNKALTKGTIYPIVKKVASILGVKMNKDIFAKGVGKIIPGLGAVLSGGLTYATYRPLAIRLRDYLETLPTSDINFTEEEVNDVDFTEILEEIDEEAI